MARAYSVALYRPHRLLCLTSVGGCLCRVWLLPSVPLLDLEVCLRYDTNANAQVKRLTDMQIVPFTCGNVKTVSSTCIFIGYQHDLSNKSAGRWLMHLCRKVAVYPKIFFENFYSHLSGKTTKSRMLKTKIFC